MQDGRSKKLKLALAVVSFVSASFLSCAAQARTSHVTHHNVHAASTHHHRSSGHVIQCVAYAKSASDVVLHGNARDWWHNAAGVYDRGLEPKAGSVLNFRATRRMPLGHVAVVRNIVDSRTIVIDQSHWAQAGISRNVSVIDVSPNNDWSAVRVALNNNANSYGSIYPTYGFIYPRSAGKDAAPASLKQEVMTAWASKMPATQLAQAPTGAQPVAAAKATP
ncbi:CHAP domain-containing protein [Acetobacter lambici]|uniref:CHAP domain-containing protein n=1 Tax=Acetobacter lambici TaxID=1332824 RepID=A0ABT1F2Z2_9PROT|nr:CHAP domain-containing protein [Acetobacter lambici]MCP1243600.1 CHAP domain-containing protein [Acetobacter lambici]MCP1259602.1 CHAP domain-containing protein [Acetobacter lambici]NHO57869.1 CHAP domain-containing protein [Acetobacter lambici]